MDRLIADGDVVQVASGITVKTIQVPIMSYHADPATRIITRGTCKHHNRYAWRTSFPPDSHCGSARQIATNAAGQYQADFTASPYIAGLLGSMSYTTADGDRVYKPIFVADPLAAANLATGGQTSFLASRTLHPCPPMR